MNLEIVVNIYKRTIKKSSAGCGCGHCSAEFC